MRRKKRKKRRGETDFFSLSLKTKQKPNPGGVLINSLHSRGGEAAANAQVAALGKWGGASACWSAFKWFFSSDAGPGCSGGFDRFPSFGLRALAWKWNFDFQLTYLGVGMICPHAVNLSMLFGAVVTW